MPEQDQTSDHTHITCSHCSCDLTGISLQGNCPECGQSIISTCFGCDYNLEGLDPLGVCPECGFLIEGSIGRGELAGANPSYLEKLHKGVFVIQTVIIVQILIMFATIGVAITLGINGNLSMVALEIATTIINLVMAFTLIYGWWLFSSEDTTYTGSYTGSEARQLVRIMIVVGAVFTLLGAVFAFLPETTVMMVIAMIIGLAALVVTVVRFFAAMLYIKWMAPLMRNKKIYNRAKLLMWLGPVLMTFGILLIGLGPLIALVMYWNMLDWIRKDLKAIRQQNQAIA